ncbi:MAG: TOBE domain-containing protein [Ruthenibacterium lactatiformans]
MDKGSAVLAVRPEDVALRRPPARARRIESVMPLGHYTQIILVRADGARLKVFIPKEQALGYIPGQTADYSFTRFKQFGAAQASA